MILVMVPFFVVAKFYNLLEEATTCSCRYTSIITICTEIAGAHTGAPISPAILYVHK